jgi:hypothetical protein
MGRLNTMGVGRSGAVTSTTTVATEVPDTFAVMTSLASPPPVGAVPELQEASVRRDAKVAIAKHRLTKTIALPPAVGSRTFAGS